MNIHQAKKRGFTSGGRGVFICQCCKRRTRELDGDHGSTELCSWCFELAGIENSISDSGGESIPTYYKEARDLLKKLTAVGANMKNWQNLKDELDDYDVRRLENGSRNV